MPHARAMALVILLVAGATMTAGLTRVRTAVARWITLGTLAVTLVAAQRALRASRARHPGPAARRTDARRRVTWQGHTMPRRHREWHRTARVGWLRAAVLGANDGIVSTASLVVGVAAAHAARGDVLIAGTAGLVAGAMSMAAGEYVSVSSQADTEAADLARERRELAADGDFEVAELTAIYVGRGLEPPLARQVAERLMAHDALSAHARDELGISEQFTARPVQAALASAATFAAGAAVPLVAVALGPAERLGAIVGGASLVCLAALGVLAARAGGAPAARSALRVTFWGALAMAVTAAVGTLFGAPAG